MTKYGTPERSFQWISGETRERDMTAEQELPAQILCDLGPEGQKFMEGAMESLTHMLEYQDLMLCYDAAIKVVCTKLDIIDTAYQARYRRNPIHTVSSRRKRIMSIVRKLYLKQVDITVTNIETYLHDVAGVRVVCPYVDDIYEVARAITGQTDVTLLAQKNYISHPKPNGYRSLHLIVRVPVSFADHVRQIETEIQIRTIAMDVWASLEHQLRYKRGGGDEELIRRLHHCAEAIAEIDAEMLAIRRNMEDGTAMTSELAQMMERLERLDLMLY